MTIVVSNRQRVHFTMEGERGAFLILYHGLFGCQHDWYRAGYVEALANDFRLILPDARGHGRSDRPEDPAEYAPDLFTSDLLAVLNDLDIRNAHFVGYGLGALVGFDLITRHPDRVRLIMLGGESPAATPAAQAHFREAAGAVRAQGLSAWLQSERDAGRLTGDGVPDEETEREPAAAMLEGLAGWEVPQAESFQAGSPITIFGATDDPAFERTQTTARKFQRARFLPFPGQSHRDLFERKDAFLDALLRFIKIARRPDGSPQEGRERDGEGNGNGGQQRKEQERFQERRGNERGNERGERRDGRSGRRGGSRRDRPWRDTRPEADRPREPESAGTESAARGPNDEQASGNQSPERSEAPAPLHEPRGSAAPVPGAPVESRESTEGERGAAGEPDIPSPHPEGQDD